MSAVGDLLISGVMPVVTIGLTIVYKHLAHPDIPQSDDESLGVFELLLASLVLAVTVWVNTSNEVQRYASIAATVFISILLPLVAFGLRAARKGAEGQRLSRGVLWTYNGIGFMVFWLTYLLTHFAVTFRKFG
jgi:hypothetical protein